MNVVFRADASIDIGTGHVMRCLTLANELQKAGHDCTFICREHEGNLLLAIEKRGFATFSLPVATERDNDLAHSNWLGATQVQDAEQCIEWLARGSVPKVDWLIVDHYGLEKSWELLLRPYTRHLMIIDDLADREHDCDILLDQNLGRKKSDYKGLVPPYCELSIGPQYALLRPEFAELRECSLQRRQYNPELKKLLISLGGVDKNNVTGQVLTALNNAELPKDTKITVVMGTTAPHLADVKEKAQQLSWQTEVVVNVSDMAQRMAEADLAIGAAGSTSWERCCLGLPTLMLVLADNQRGIGKALEAEQACILVNDMNCSKTFINLLEKYDTKRLRSSSYLSAQVCSGLGAPQLVQKLLNLQGRK